jgi:hypothetical protein
VGATTKYAVGNRVNKLGIMYGRCMIVVDIYVMGVSALVS